MESREAERGGAAGHAHRMLASVRVAVAMAVIRSRPPGVSGRHHAEALARRLTAQDRALGGTVQDLRQEVLRLRQEVALSRAGAGATAQEVDFTSQDLFGPDSSISTETLPLSHTPSLEATPPHAPPQTAQDQAVSRTTPPSLRFLQSLCELQRVGGHRRPLEGLWLGPGGETTPLVVDSVCCLLDSVVAMAEAGHAPPCPPPPGLSCDPVLEACQVASRATELLCSQGEPTDLDVGRLEEPLGRLTETLLNWDQTSGVQTTDRVAEQLLALGSGCSLFRSFLLRHFLSEVGGVAEQLWEAHQGQCSLQLFPVRRYNNSFLLLRLLEELLLLRPQGSAPPAGHAHFLQRLFPLADEFPLFAICAWRVGRLLAAPQSQQL